DLVLDELGLVLQGRVEVASRAGHGLEDAHLEGPARGVGLHEGPLRRLCRRAEGPGALVANQEAGPRGDLDAADHPLPDTEVADEEEQDDGQEGLGHGAQGLSAHGIHGWLSSSFGTASEKAEGGRLTAEGLVSFTALSLPPSALPEVCWLNSRKRS